MLFLAERVNIMEFNETMKINLEFDKEKEEFSFAPLSQQQKKGRRL